MFYLVSEIQEINGARNVINHAYGDNETEKKAAEGKYYAILSAATQSKADYIGATLTQCGDIITQLMSKAYDNRPKPEPEEV